MDACSRVVDSRLLSSGLEAEIIWNPSISKWKLRSISISWGSDLHGLNTKTWFANRIGLGGFEFNSVDDAYGFLEKHAKLTESPIPQS